MSDLGLIALAAFAAATFAGALIAGLSGFAFGLIAASVWLYILTPARTAELIVFFALVIQGVAMWRLRQAVKLDRVAPFVIGGALGVPLGVEILRVISAGALRVAVSFMLIGFSLHGLLRPKLARVAWGGRIADGAVGFLGGVLGGSTGFAGILTIIWCNLRGWPRDEQRMVFQPVIAATFVMVALWLGGAGLVDADTLGLFAIGLPFLLAGHWLGLRLYGWLDEQQFRRIVLILLLVSGLALAFTQARGLAS